MVFKSPVFKSPISANLLDDLQTALAHGNVARRVDMLRKVTDLFIDHAADYSTAQIAVFDDVFECLIDHLEAETKMLLAERLAPADSAPPLGGGGTRELVGVGGEAGARYEGGYLERMADFGAGCGPGAGGCGAGTEALAG